MIFFFFQAEDGIRDKLVTGVQTCALPICLRTVKTHKVPLQLQSPQQGGSPSMDSSSSSSKLQPYRATKSLGNRQRMCSRQKAPASNSFLAHLATRHLLPIVSVE